MRSTPNTLHQLHPFLYFYSAEPVGLALDLEDYHPSCYYTVGWVI